MMGSERIVARRVSHELPQGELTVLVGGVSISAFMPSATPEQREKLIKEMRAEVPTLDYEERTDGIHFIGEFLLPK